MISVFMLDIGTSIILDCGVDVSLASVCNIKVRKPNGTIVFWPAVAHETNYIKHTVLSGELDQTGVWRLQASVTIPGWSGLGDVVTLQVNKGV